MIRRETDRARRVVFLKLHKTGGTTLAASVLFPYCIKYNLQYMVPQGWWAVHPGCVQGNSFHMMFRHFPDYPQPWARNWLRKVIGDYQPITILRDPIDRIVSEFNHAAHHYGVESFDQFLQNLHEWNHQSRWLGYFGRDEKFLEHNFAGVGVTERMNESMLLFRRCLDMDLEDMLYSSVYRDTPKALRKADLTQEQLARIRNSDWLDIELHEQATKLVESRIAAAPDMEQELQEFERALADFSHPLWEKRGPFSIGFDPNSIWYEFTGRYGTVRQLQELPP